MILFPDLQKRAHDADDIKSGVGSSLLPDIHNGKFKRECYKSRDLTFVPARCFRYALSLGLRGFGLCVGIFLD